MAVSSNQQKIVFDGSDEQLPAEALAEDTLTSESLVIKAFGHTSGREGLQLGISDFNAEAHFFLTPAEASLLRNWLNARNL